MSLTPTPRLYAIIFMAGLLISGIVMFWLPEYAKYYTKDNRIVENIGAQLFLWSGIASLWAAFIWRSRRYIPIAFALISFVCALDEISWGRGEIEFEPYKVMGVKIDAVHDFMDVFRNIFEQYGSHPLPWLFLVLVIAVVLFVVFHFRHFFASFFTPPRGALFGTIVLFFIASSFGDLVDLDLSKMGEMRLSILEEYLETAGALALFFIAWSLIREGRHDRREVPGL